MNTKKSKKNQLVMVLCLLMIAQTKEAKSDLLFTTNALLTIAGATGVAGYFAGQKHSSQTCHSFSSRSEPVCDYSNNRSPDQVWISHGREPERQNSPGIVTNDTFEVYR
ncbi:MAG: hypothetical protein HQL99_15225 [Magnetococcales bacterium]|nr:hypothetical protein [Magnetococcales bacterium]